MYSNMTNISGKGKSAKVSGRPKIEAIKK